MAQETTEEFAHRFGRAVEGHPLAPPTPHGRQRWVLEKLENEAGLTVSPNTMSKWFHGTARPRPDNIRKIARVLKVDEVWLAMGQKPADQMSATMGQAESAKGAVLLVAGLVEMAGGRVTFGAKNDKAADLQINMNGEQFSAIVVTLTDQGKTSSCIIPEPIGDSRVIAVTQPKAHDGVSACVCLYDLTQVQRTTLGGYAIVELENRPGDKFKAPGLNKLLTPLQELGEAA